MDSGPSAAPPTGEQWEQPPQQPPNAPPVRRRLYREPDDKKLAGICGGLADYTGVDPALVRAGAVLLAVVAPVTIVAYLVAIFAIDERPPSVPRVIAPPVEVIERHRWLPLLLLACAVLMTVGGAWWWWPGFDMPVVALILVGVGVWLLARSRSDEPGGWGSSGGPGGPGGSGGSGGSAGPEGPSPFAAPTEQPRNVVVDPLQKPWSPSQGPTNLSQGVDITTPNEEAGPTADRAADLRAAADEEAGVGGLAPRTGPPMADEGAGPPGEFPPLTPPEWSGPQAAPRLAAPPAGRGSERLGLTVTALVLIGGGFAWFLHVADITDVDPRPVLAVGLVIVGLGLALAAWRGRARAALIPLGFVAVLALASGEIVDVPLDAGMGDRRVVATRARDVDQPIELLAGELVVDLRDLRLSTRRPTEVEAGVGVGRLQVLVPREANLVVDTNVRVGGVTGALTDRTSGDADAGVLLDETYELDGREGAPRIELTMDVGIGEAEVVRG